MFASVLTLNWFWLIGLIPVLPAAEPPRNTNQDTIQWEEKRRLTWNDFKALPDEKDPLHAITSANIDVKLNCNNQKLSYEITSVFVATDSWSKDKNSAKLLQHEQMHFDLTEVHARTLRKKLSTLINPCKLPEEVLNKLINGQFEAWKMEQDKYDHETDHGLKEKEQKKWSEQIAFRLNALKEYSSSKQ